MTELFSSAADLGKPRQKVIKLRDTGNGNISEVLVTDKYPSMGDVHVEGRHSVEVSVELFLGMAKLMGMEPVDPREEAQELADGLAIERLGEDD